jgi:hypothetical protein
MSIELIRVEVGRNCTHGGVMYGKGSYAVAPATARAMQTNGDLSKPLDTNNRVSLDDYDAARMKTGVPPPADLRTGYGAAQVASDRSTTQSALNPTERRTDNETATRTPSAFDMGAETGEGEEGNFLISDTSTPGGTGRAPEGGSVSGALPSGIVSDGSTGGGSTGAASGGAASSVDRGGVLISQGVGEPGGAGAGGAAGGSTPPATGYAQTSPGQLSAISPTGAETPTVDTTGAGAGAGTAADDPGADVDAGAPPPPVTADAPLKGEIPTDFPKRTELANAGITSLEQLSTMNREQLIGVRGIGEKSVEEIGLRLYQMAEQGREGDAGGVPTGGAAQ